MGGENRKRGRAEVTKVGALLIAGKKGAVPVSKRSIGFLKLFV